MPENETAKTSSSSSGSSYGVPAAIVIAGGLIALAVYFGGGKTDNTGGEIAIDGPPNGPGQGEVAGVVVGDIRSVGDDDHVRGAKDAKVTIVEYSDTECPFCKRHHLTMKKIVEEYPNDVRWVYRHFPLEQLHSQAVKEAEAVECAGEQGKAWEMLDLIYEITPSNDGLDLTKLPEFAGQAGVSNIGQFESCLESGKFADKVELDAEDAVVAGGRGTPYNVIIGPDGEKTPLSGAQPLESIKAAVEKLL